VPVPVVLAVRQALRALTGERPPWQINDGDGNGWTPLHYAASSGKSALMALQVLLEHHADFDRKNNKGETPLHVACAGRHIESASELIKAGCNYGAKNKDDLEAFDLLDPATRETWERDRWIRAAVEQGRHVRERIAIRVKEEADKAAEAKRLREAERKAAAAAAEAAAEVEAAVGKKTGAGGGENVASKRQKYMALRDHMAMKMKRSKAESRKAVQDISVALDHVRIEEERKRRAEADEKASYRAIPGCKEALDTEEARHELEILRHADAQPDEIDQCCTLLVCESAARNMKITALEHEAELASTQQRLEAAANRAHDLSRLVPLAKLLGAAIRLDRRRVVLEEEAARAPPPVRAAAERGGGAAARASYRGPAARRYPGGSQVRAVRQDVCRRRIKHCCQLPLPQGMLQEPYISRK
jgi:hypothetical protein